MVDLAPEGFISLRDFYDQLTSWRWNTANLVEELDLENRIAVLPEERRQRHRAGFNQVIDESLSEAVALFATDKLHAFVVVPGGAGRSALSPRVWREAHFPERLFLATEIGVGHGGEFEAAVGRTPFVERSLVSGYLREASPRRSELPSSRALRECLIGVVMDGAMAVSEAEELRHRWNLAAMSRRPSTGKYDPKREVAWTLPMAMSWLVWRSYYRVAEAMDGYRDEWWEWKPIHYRLPLRGGAEWYEVEGAELRTQEPLTMFKMGIMEALTERDEFEDLAMPVKAARMELWGRLAEGRLAATGITPAGEVCQIPPHEWPYLALEADGRLMDRLVFTNGRHQAAYEKVTVRQLDVVSLWEGYPEPPDPPLMSYLADQPTWTFLEAATWVGCKGKELPSRQIADEDLEERGAYALFKALFPERGLVATGLNRKRLREPIPAEYWEMATKDPGMFGERHYVSFIDDVLSGYGGQLTPVGEESPRWFGIRLDRGAMLAAFPQFVQQATSEGVAGGSNRTPPIRTADKLESTCQALRELYANGFPKALSAKDRLKRINDWHAAHGTSAVSPATLRRAATLVFRER